MLDVVIKPTSATSGGGERFNVQVEGTITVQELKDEVAKHCSLSASQQRLIYKGKILKDHMKLVEYGLESGHVCHLVKAREPAEPSSPNAPAGASPVPGNPAAAEPRNPSNGSLAGIQALMSPQNPMMQSLMSNPEALQTMMNSNPVVRRLMESNPEIAQALSDPDTVQQTLRVMSNPNLMAEQMRTNDVAMRNIETMPGGFDYLRRAFTSMDGAVSHAQESTASEGSGDTGLMDMLRSLGVTGNAANADASATQVSTATDADAGPGRAAQGPNEAPLPNPWSQPSGGADGGLGALAGLMQGGSIGGPGATGAGAAFDPAQMMQTPAVQEMLQHVAGNPEMMRTMIGADPRMRRLMEANPDVQRLLSDPERMRQMFRPEVLQASMQMAQAMQTLQGAGLMSQRPDDRTSGGGAAVGVPDFASLFGALNGQPGGVGGGGVPDFASLLGAMGGAAGAGTAAPVANPEEAYAAQLQQLADMGFVDREANIRALQACGGNVQAALERLL